MYKSYQQVINQQLTLSPEKWTFKGNRIYNGILEHVSPELGNKYLEIIQDKYKTFFEENLNFLKSICKLNDKYGKTNQSYFKNFIICSPSNLRYILHSILILEEIKKYNLKEIDIIEIGGGYGGLCLFIHKLSQFYNININSYSIFDLVEASQLQKKYLNAHDIDVNVCQINNFDNLKTNSFLISNYAFSEIELSLQKEYTEKILNPYTSYGFLAWNFIELYDFVSDSKIQKEPEYPNTNFNGTNYYVRYHKKS